MEIFSSPSPNFDRRRADVDMLVLHYTGMKSGSEALERLCDWDVPVSAHYLIEEDGRIFQLVDESARAWHAGVSYWAGERDINSRSIGIEMVNPGHEWGLKDFPQSQMDSLLWLSKDIKARHKISDRFIVGHSDVAPERKTDPGERFNWRWLSEQGIGLWPEKRAGHAFHSDQDLTHAFAHFGYNVDGEGQLFKVTTAFQRRFRAEKIDGVADEECRALLAGLIDLIEERA